MPRHDSAGHPELADDRNAEERAIRVFRRHGGVLRTKEALAAGIHPRTLYHLRDAGVLECLSRGLHRLTEFEPLAEPDLVTVAMRSPRAVVCLISALSYHNLTTQIPREVHVALPRGAERPQIEYPPVAVYWFSGRAYSQGIEAHVLDGVSVQIYNREKTIADCFRYRNRIGLDTCLESLHLYKQQRRVDVDALLDYAALRGVKRVMTPYLEAVL